MYNVKNLTLNTECQMFNLCVSIELPARLSVFKHAVWISVHHSLMDVFDCAYSLTPQQLQHWPPRLPPPPPNPWPLPRLWTEVRPSTLPSRDAHAAGASWWTSPNGPSSAWWSLRSSRPYTRRACLACLRTRPSTSQTTMRWEDELKTRGRMSPWWFFSIWFLLRVWLQLLPGCGRISPVSHLVTKLCLARNVKSSHYLCEWQPRKPSSLHVVAR